VRAHLLGHREDVRLCAREADVAKCLHVVIDRQRAVRVHDEQHGADEGVDLIDLVADLEILQHGLIAQLEDLRRVRDAHGLSPNLRHLTPGLWAQASEKQEVNFPRKVESVLRQEERRHGRNMYVAFSPCPAKPVSARESR
jgi:hypothetical protein